MSNENRARGVRKVNEKVFDEFRTLIVSNKAISDEGYLPYGTLYINPRNGNMEVWIEGDVWKPIQFTIINNGGGGSNDAWQPYTTINLGRMTEANVERYIAIFVEQINELERLVEGDVDYPGSYNYSDRIRDARTKLLSIMDTAIPGSAEQVAIRPATNTFEALTVIREGIILAYQLLLGMTITLEEIDSGEDDGIDLDVVRSSVREIVLAIEDDSTYTNSNATLSELVRDIITIVDVIADVEVDYLTDLTGKTDMQVYALVMRAIEEIRDVIYDTE